MGAVPEATELRTETKRGHRAGVEAVGCNRALVFTFRFRQKGGEVVAGMGGQVAKASRLVTISECGPLTEDVMLDVKRSRALNEASVTTKSIPANEADTLGDRFRESLDCRDRLAGVHPGDMIQDVRASQWSDMLDNMAAD